MLRQSRVSRVSTTLLSAFFLLLFAATPNTSNAQKDDALYAAGEKVFKGNCASCHKPDADMTGPALKGSRARWEGKGDIYAWIKNSTAYRNTGNSVANEIFAAWKNSVMTPNAISNGDIDAVLHYVDYYEPKVKVLPKEDVAQVDEGDNSLVIWLLIIGLLFTVVALSVGGVKRQLDSALSEQAGKGPIPDSTGWQRFVEWCGNHKYWASIIGIFLFCFLITKSYMWAMDIGVYGGEDVEHYRPSQPIAFDHTLHAGAAKDNNLEINCQYCHSSAEKSKHAGIPSTNVCMNCHKAVNKGRTDAGTADIQKIYDAVGWDGKEYSMEEKPLVWNKVHNLPDHVYFSHAQHVAVGKLECQECHGPIDKEMKEAEQWAPLTMGWCINCHNQKEIKLDGNGGYYDEVKHRLYATDLGHKELQKYLEDGKITVKELGGWECAKCHY
ncbi:MAG: c-type cytochrome [Flavobacteriales bacterium]|nr:c-type cytochrome [Flavobacteriales bacterium]